MLFLFNFMHVENLFILNKNQKLERRRSIMLKGSIQFLPLNLWYIFHFPENYITYCYNNLSKIYHA